VKGELWLGSLDSADGYIRYLEYVAANPLLLGQTRAEAFQKEEQPEAESTSRFKSELIKDFNNVGVIEIKGGLTNKDNWVTQLFGLSTYPEIIRAASELMLDDSITDIVLDIDSGGGTAAGIESVSRSLKAVASVKPVYAITGGQMASAAYWLGSTASKVHATQMAQLGSIGVVATHMSMVGRLGDEGIEATVLRAGKYKAPGSQFEKLSERDQGILQKELDTLHGFFLEHVATSRNLSMSDKAAWGEGQTFFGTEAIEVGLADKIMSPEELILSLEKSGAVDNHSSPANNSLNITGDNQMSLENRREVILHSEEDRAAVAAGAPLESFEHEEVTVDVAAEAAALEAEAAAALPEEDEAVENPHDAMVSQMMAMAAENAVLKRDLEEARTSQTSAASVLDSLSAGLAAQTNRMEIGLRRAETNFTGMPASTIVEKYEATRQDFDARFKVGRQTTQASEEPTQVARLGIVPRSA
jgi:signal peptide peptidase SppA